jgi:hypothetical protein
VVKQTSRLIGWVLHGQWLDLVRSVPDRHGYASFRRIYRRLVSEHQE